MGRKPKLSVEEKVTICGIARVAKYKESLKILKNQLT